MVKLEILIPINKKEWNKECPKLKTKIINETGEYIQSESYFWGNTLGVRCWFIKNGVAYWHFTTNYNFLANKILEKQKVLDNIFI